MQATEARRLAGDVIMLGIPGARLDSPVREVLAEVQPSGVILFRRNYEEPGQLRALTAELHRLPWRPRIAIDHEGGKVMRLGAPFTQFPPAAWIARTGDPRIAYAVGHAMGTELASHGIDIDFAPVLDVDSNPHNPVIGERAFGRTPEEVAAFALPFAQGLRAAGVVPCGKHFPGHGDTDKDSHQDLPLVRKSRTEIETVELAPFRAAIAAPFEMLMTAHVIFTALDPERAATVSPAITRDLLRAELGFRGVVASDDLEMRGVSAERGTPEAAVAALAAGVDWALVCNDLELARRTHARIVEAIVSGELTGDALRAGAERIHTLPRPTAAPPLALPCDAHEALNRRIRAAALA